MDGFGDAILSKVRQTQKGKQHMILLICGISNSTNEHLLKTRSRVRDVESNHGYQGMGEGINWEIGILMYKKDG